jgi:hypothetical protein
MSEVVVKPKNLVLTTLTCLVLALVVLVAFVLPAEYGEDPTGFGELIGIKGMSGYSVGALSNEEAHYTSDEVYFLLEPFDSIEYKYNLAAGQSMVFSWDAGGEVTYDFHSEEEGTDPDDAVSFDIGKAANRHGTYVAPYTGIHGWFWENRGTDTVEVRLRTTGFFTAATTFSASGEQIRRFETDAPE